MRWCALAAVVACACAHEPRDDRRSLGDLVDDASDRALEGVLDPELGRRPACELPPRRCVGSRRYCRELIELSPAEGPGYEDVRLPEERSPRRSSSYLRRDVAMLVTYAAARVACETAAWPGPVRPIVLGDMSQRSGQVPGSWNFEPRHPAGSHEGGRDIDIAYYQLGTEGNDLRPICPHTLHGHERYHCVAPPTTLDAMRTALFIGALFEERLVRGVGIDGQAVAPIEEAGRRLCRARWLHRDACARLEVQLFYETADSGLGWFYSHHHHLHVSAWPG